MAIPAGRPIGLAAIRLVPMELIEGDGAPPVTIDSGKVIASVEPGGWRRNQWLYARCLRRPLRVGGGTVPKMLVLRYFGYVGGSLLALLFVCNAVFPKQPLPDVLSSDPERPAIRIHSEKKWPERVVFDTSMAPVATPAPATIAQADTPASPKVEAPSITAKARVREAFAQLTPAEPKPEAKAELKVQPQPKRKVVAKVAKVHVGRPLVLASQQPRFGWVDNTW